MFKSESFDEIKKEFDEHRNSHSYIFYTNDFFSCQKDVYELIKYIFNKDSLELIDNDLIIIKKSEKKSILKDDMLDLKNMFQKTSYMNKYRLYLIEEAHKLNSTTANMILKFLEEPLYGVIAFFITDNLDLVLDTIKSRCQIVNSFYDANYQFNDNKDIEKLESLLFNSNKYFSLVKIKSVFSNYDRNELIELFRYLLEKQVNLSMTVENISKIKVINKAIKMLGENVNIEFVFDYILLKGCD